MYSKPDIAHSLIVRASVLRNPVQSCTTLPSQNFPCQILPAKSYLPNPLCQILPAKSSLPNPTCWVLAMQIWKALLLVATIFCVTALYYFKNLSTFIPLDPSLIRITNTSVDRACPIRNFVLVKTHKTGGSTLANIMMRYTENNRLNILLSR